MVQISFLMFLRLIKFQAQIRGFKTSHLLGFLYLPLHDPLNPHPTPLCLALSPCHNTQGNHPQSKTTKLQIIHTSLLNRQHIELTATTLAITNSTVHHYRLGYRQVSLRPKEFQKTAAYSKVSPVLLWSRLLPIDLFNCNIIIIRVYYLFPVLKVFAKRGLLHANGTFLFLCCK